MKEFPNFMRNELNHIDSSQQNTKDIMGTILKGMMVVKWHFGRVML